MGGLSHNSGYKCKWVLFIKLQLFRADQNNKKGRSSEIDYQW